MENGGLAVYFGENLAQILSQKIKAVYPKFDAQSYYRKIAATTPNFGYSQRILAHANALNELSKKTLNATQTAKAPIKKPPAKAEAA